MSSSEIIFEVTEAIEGVYEAKALGYSIFTQGDDWADLKPIVKDAVLCYFDAGEAPDAIRFNMVKSTTTPTFEKR